MPLARGTLFPQNYSILGLTNFLAKHAGAAAVGSASRRTLLPQPLLALFILALLAIAFYWDVLFTNRAIFPWDAFDFFYPLLSYVHEELQQLRMPLWNPYLFGGFPIIADPEAQIFYPPNWFFL